MANEDEPAGGTPREDADAAPAAASGAAAAEAAEIETKPDQGNGSPDRADTDAASAAVQDAGGESGGLDQADIDAALSGDQADQATPGRPEPPKDAPVDAAGNPIDDVAAATPDAVEAEASDGAQPAPASVGAAATAAAAGAEAVQAEVPDLGSIEPGPETEGQIDLLEDVELNVKIELGRTCMLVEDVLKLAGGSVVELNKLAGDPVDVLINDRLIARGEVLVLNDNFCVRINEIISEQGEAIRS